MKLESQHALACVWLLKEVCLEAVPFGQGALFKFGHCADAQMLLCLESTIQRMIFATCAARSDVNHDMLLVSRVFGIGADRASKFCRRKASSFQSVPKCAGCAPHQWCAGCQDVGDSGQACVHGPILPTAPAVCADHCTWSFCLWIDGQWPDKHFEDVLAVCRVHATEVAQISRAAAVLGGATVTAAHTLQRGQTLAPSTKGS
eukprot:1158637-Pelagomonas_calceolata.AAC.7